MDFQTLKYKIKSLPLVGSTYDALIGNRKVERIKAARKAALKEYGNDVLQAVGEVMDELRVDWYVDYGSLLGIIRDGHFIEYDDDLDFAFFSADPALWSRMEEAFAKRGMKKVRSITYNGQLEEMTFAHHDLTFDLFRHWRENGQNLAYCFYNKPGVEYPGPNMYSPVLLKHYDFAQTRPMSYDGLEIRVPSEPEKYLASVYTDNWRIPDPNWKADMSPGWNDLEGLATIDYWQ